MKGLRLLLAAAFATVLAAACSPHGDPVAPPLRPPADTPARDSLGSTEGGGMLGGGGRYSYVGPVAESGAGE